MQITGPQLLRLLEKDGWKRRGIATHGVFVYKQFPGESVPRSTVIPMRKQPLKEETLGGILSMKQTRLGRAGLEELIVKYGL